MSAWYSWFNMLVGLVVIINPLMGVSAFATLAGGESPAQRRVTARIAALTIGVVLTVAALGGDALLAFFGIGIPEFQVGGGVLILLMAVSMMNAQIGSARQTEEEADEAYVKSQIGVVPLGVPLLAGPGAISTVIIYALKESWLGRVVLIAEIWLVAAMVWLALSLGDWLTDRLGKTGINIATRIMGLLLAAIAVGFLTQGLKVLLPGLA
jgi:multiple antibiotic resistance protein